MLYVFSFTGREKKKKKPLCTPSIYIGHFKQNSESEDRPSKVKASIVCPLAPALV